MIEILIEIFCEFLLQIAAELLFEVGLHAITEPFRKKPDPWIAAPGYFLFGALCGGLSLVVFSHHLVAHKAFRMANLILAPIVAGGVMALLGKWRERRGQLVLRIDRFAYGYLFALGLALMRFLFAQ